jgi:predicted GIY-YIG superfamily endonuclease
VDDYRNVCYLIHFDRPINRAGVQHYIGFTTDLRARIAEHRGPKGAMITRRANAEGIPWRVVRVWRGGSLDIERELKKLGGVNLCPLCSKYRFAFSNQTQGRALAR